MSGTKKSSTHSIHIYSQLLRVKSLLSLIVAGLLLYLVLAGFSGLQRSMSALSAAEPYMIGVAIVLIVLSYVCAALAYKLLSAKYIGILPTLLVQIAGGLVNRLLPSGLGGLGINAFYLKNRGHTFTEATTIVATNNSIGFIGNILLVIIASVATPFVLPIVDIPDIPWVLLSFGGVALITLGVFINRRPKLNRRIRKSLSESGKYMVLLTRRPVRSSAALLSSLTLTALHVGAMYAVLSSIGIDAEWTFALLAISLGAFLGAVVPTPGGLGGAEAGIVAVLLAYSVSSSDAIAAALLYRGITYWLPLLPGYVALRIVERRYLY